MSNVFHHTEPAQRGLVAVLRDDLLPAATALFIAGVDKRSSWYALGFVVAAVAIGGLLPRAFFSHDVATPRLIALVADWSCSPGWPSGWRRAVAAARRGARRGGGDHAARLQRQLDLALEALSILALMFTGTMLYRAEQGLYPWPRAIAIGVTYRARHRRRPVAQPGLGFAGARRTARSRAGSPRSCWPA